MAISYFFLFFFLTTQHNKLMHVSREIKEENQSKIYVDKWMIAASRLNLMKMNFLSLNMFRPFFFSSFLISIFSVLVLVVLLFFFFRELLCTRQKF